MSTCRRKSKWGKCGLPADHETEISTMHAVPIGDNLWFGFMRTQANQHYMRFGYMKREDGEWVKP